MLYLSTLAEYVEALRDRLGMRITQFEQLPKQVDSFHETGFRPMLIGWRQTATSLKSTSTGRRDPKWRPFSDERKFALDISLRNQRLRFA